MQEIKGLFRTEVQMFAWKGLDRCGDKLIARWDGTRSEWTVTTYAIGAETSVTNLPGRPIFDMTEMFRTVRAAMR